MTHKNDMLERQLREQAKALREMNGFSPLLHQRIMASLRQQGLAGTPIRVARGWGEGNAWRIAGWSAAAAAVLVILSVVIFKAGHTTDTPQPPETPIATNPVVVDPAPVVTAQLNSVGSSRVDLQACKLEYSIVSPK